MGKVLAGILLALLIPVHASVGQYGASYLGMCSRAWPCKESLEVFDGLDVKRTGWLSRTFGDECSCAKQFFGLPGKKYVRVHIANCTCFPERGRRCGKYEPFYKESIKSAEKKLNRRDGELLKRYRTSLAITKKNLEGVNPADTDVRLSLCLESVFSHRARKEMLREAVRAFPDGVFVDSVIKGPCLQGLICERHGVAPDVTEPCIVDTDGDDYRVVFPEARPQCEATMLWEPGFNLIDFGLNRFQDPRRRTEAPSQHDFDYLKRALTQP